MIWHRCADGPDCIQVLVVVLKLPISSHLDVCLFLLFCSAGMLCLGVFLTSYLRNSAFSTSSLTLHCFLCFLLPFVFLILWRVLLLLLVVRLVGFPSLLKWRLLWNVVMIVICSCSEPAMLSSHWTMSSSLGWLFFSSLMAWRYLRLKTQDSKVFIWPLFTFSQITYNKQLHNFLIYKVKETSIKTTCSRWHGSHL